jgi:long-subunit acyl-CoA synthetase (AMP-forming)
VPAGDKKKKKKKKSDDGAAAAADDDDDDDDDAPAAAADKGKAPKGDHAAPAAAAQVAPKDPAPKAADPDTLIPYPKSASPFWRVEPDACVEIRLAKKGVAARPATTVNELLQMAVSKHGDKPALSWEDGGKWQSMTWVEYHQQIRAAAKSLIHIGMKAHEAVSIIGFNSKEWFIANLGAIAAGGKAAGIYTTNATDACKYIVEHSDSRVVVCENAAQLNKFLPIRAELTHVDAYIVWSGALPDGVNGADKKGGKVYTWADFMKLGADVDDSRLEKRIKAQKPGHCCTLIYTSGTTGHPKAVMVSHDNLTWTAQALFDHAARLWHRRGARRSRTCRSRTSPRRWSTFTCRSALRRQTRAATPPCTLRVPTRSRARSSDTLTACRPTVFFGVPRVWEKFAEKMKAVGATTTGLKKKLVWGLRPRARRSRSTRRPQIGHVAASRLANRRVLSKVRVALGLDRCKFQMTGAAPIARDAALLWLAQHAGLRALRHVREHWPADALVSGTLQGRLVRPRAAGLRDQDRPRRRCATSRARVRSPAISNVMMVGDRRKYNVCLITLRLQANEDGTFTNQLTGASLKIDSKAKTVEEAQTDAVWKAYIQAGLDAANKTAVSNASKIQKFKILPTDFGVATGELTATLKLKRTVVSQMYAAAIDEMYAEGGAD